MSNLYTLTNSFMQIQTMIEDGQDGLNDTLESIDAAIEEKLENIGKVIRNLDGEVSALKSEEKRLADKRKSIENNIKRLKDYAEDNLTVTGKDKLKVGLFTFAMQKNPPSVQINDESLIPKRYYVPVDPRLDKSSIKDLLRSGESVPGVELVRGKSLRIR